MTRPFSISSESNAARAGTLKLSHGRVQTPFFMPVATKGSVKLVSMSELREMKTQCMISNGYIFSLRPGLETVSKAGGIHAFMGWHGGLFTDSGGFQILRPEFFPKITDSEVVFKNPFDGQLDFLSPEKSILIQNTLSSDVAMCLDDVPSFGVTPQRLAESVERTTAWAKRCLDAHQNKKQLLFGIAQGGTDAALRLRSAQALSELDFDGFALGGLGIGEPAQLQEQMIRIDTTTFPAQKPRYLMGVGTPAEILRAVSLGVDCFDSAYPTHTARHGQVFSHAGLLNLSSAKFRFDLSPLDKNCDCDVCQSHSRAYLHHLFRTGEENAGKHVSFHNLFFIQQFMRELREAIASDRLTTLAKEYNLKLPSKK